MEGERGKVRSPGDAGQTASLHNKPRISVLSLSLPPCHGRDSPGKTSFTVDLYLAPERPTGEGGTTADSGCPRRCSSQKKGQMEGA